MAESFHFSPINESYPNSWIYYNFTQDKAEKLFTLLIKKSCEDPQFQSFLAKLLDEFSNSSNYNNEKWIITSNLLPYKQISDDLSKEFAMTDFNNIKTEFTEFIKPFLNQQTIPEAVLPVFCFNFLFFRDSFPHLFYTLLPIFDPIFQRIGFDPIYKAIGPESLSFITVPDFDFFKTLDVDPKVIVLFFKYPIVYTSQRFANLLQDKFRLKTPQCQLVDLSIVNNQHFLDVLNLRFTNLFEEQDVFKLPADLQAFEAATPYFAIHKYDLILANPPKFLPIFQQPIKQEILNETMTRLKNDFDLISMVSFLTSNELTANDLLTHSITYHCQFSLGTPQVLEYANKQYFIITDQDSHTDFDVIRGYRIFKFFLSSCKSPSKQLKQTIISIKNLLTVMSPIIRQKLCIDLFSLIFLKQNDSFVCHPFVAQKMVKLLLQFDSNPYFVGAKNVFSSKKPKKTDSMNLSMYLQHNLNEIYHLVETHKWESADEKTENLPYFKKYYRKARAAYLFQSKHELPSEFEPESESTKIDLACSKLNKKSIEETIEKEPKLHSILQPRLKMKDVTDAFKCITTSPQWELASSSAVELDEYPLEQISNSLYIRKHLKNIAISKQLLNFISDTRLYFESASIYESDGTLESIFVLDMRRALAGPFNFGDIKKSEELALLYNIDLFPFILENIELFKISEEFISNNITKYPIEMLALAFSHHFDDYLRSNEKTPEPFKKFIEKPKPKKTPPHLLDLLKEDKIDEAENYIYKVDHKLFYNKLIREFDYKSFNDSLMYALNICDYVAPESDFNLLKKIKTYYKVKKITSKENQSEIITDIYHDNQFELAIDYITICVSEESIGETVCTLFSLCVGNEYQMTTILRLFQNHFDLLSSRFHHIEGVIQYLVKECPASKLNLVKGLTILPKEITMNSNIFDLKSVIEAYSRHINCIYMIDKEVASLFTDRHFYILLELIENSSEFNKAFIYLIPFFDDQKELQEWWINKTCAIIRNVKVDSIESEQNHLSKLHKRIDPFLQKFKGKCERMRWIRSVTSFVEFQPFLKHKISYDLEFFEQNKFEFAKLCVQFDRMLIAAELGININKLLLNRIEILMTIGLYQQIRQIFKSRPQLHFDDYDEGRVYYDNNYKPFEILTRQPIFDTRRIHSLLQTFPVPQHNVIEPLFVFQQIKVTRSQKQIKQRDPFYDFMISNAVTKPNSLAFLVTYKDYETAFKYIDTKIGEERNDLFVYKFFLPALCNGTLNTLEKYILNEKGEEYSRFIWTNTLHFFERRQCRHAMFNINRKLGNWEAAADDCFRLFDEEESLPHQTELLGHALYCLTEALNQPQTEEPRDALEDKKAKTTFQLKLCQFFNDKGTPNKKEYNLMRGQSAALALGALFLINGEKPLLNELSTMFPLDPKAVSEKASETLLTMELGQIMKCLRMMRNESPSIAEYVQSALLRKLQARGIYNKQTILAIILEGWTNPMKQLLLMIEYDIITEALTLASRERIGELIPLIARRASVLGLSDVVHKCKKILNPPQQIPEA